MPLPRTGWQNRHRPRGPVGGHIQKTWRSSTTAIRRSTRSTPAFVGRRLAEELHRRLAAVSMSSALRLTVEAVTQLGSVIRGPGGR